MSIYNDVKDITFKRLGAEKNLQNKDLYESYSEILDEIIEEATKGNVEYDYSKYLETLSKTDIKNIARMFRLQGFKVDLAYNIISWEN